LVEFPIVGWFDAYNEVLRGVGRSDSLKLRAVLVLEGERTGMRCVGQRQVVARSLERDPVDQCSGEKGHLQLECEDGRQIQGSTTGLTCTRGAARGTDQFGNTLNFVLGFQEAELTELARRERALSTSRPPLPRHDASRAGSSHGFNTGTGFFVTSQGHMVTNFHVVRGARQLAVVTPDGRTLRAEYLRGDLETDLALLKVDSQTTPLPIARGDVLFKGQEVLALGYPLVTLQGQEVKASFGHVNARSGMNGDPAYSQIDVPIQPGNSGGPLLDRNGRVVGVVTAMLNPLMTLRLAGALPQNVNYALKSELVLDLLRDEFGETWEPEPGEPAAESLRGLVARTEQSVGLIISRLGDEVASP
jgi:S1-C subfamily serine protease